MFRSKLRIAGAIFGALLDVAVTLFVVVFAIVAGLLFLIAPGLFIPHRKPSEGIDAHHAH
ncbi:MAG: hypothetical protein H6839_03360 [Planctomycetes bacterium]|nr:hypothetical protein [Planctomycetota bacterium]